MNPKHTSRPSVSDKVKQAAFRGKKEFLLPFLFSGVCGFSLPWLSSAALRKSLCWGKERSSWSLEQPVGTRLCVGMVGTADRFLPHWSLEFGKKFSQQASLALEASTDMLDFTTVVSNGGPAVEAES